MKRRFCAADNDDIGPRSKRHRIVGIDVRRIRQAPVAVPPHGEGDFRDESHELGTLPPPDARARRDTLGGRYGNWILAHHSVLISDPVAGRERSMNRMRSLAP